MIDFHCHLDLYPSALKTFEMASKLNYYTLAVTTSPRAWRLAKHYFANRKNIGVALGLHPEIAVDKFNELSFFLNSIPETSFIGEIGIDGTAKYKGTLDVQKEIFEKVLLTSEACGGKILSIHSRNAAQTVLDYIESTVRLSIPVLHWFSGSLQEAQHAVGLDCWFSIGPPMLCNKNGLAIIDMLPMNKILPETDGPFATHNGKSLMPWDTSLVIDGLSRVRGIKREKLQEQMHENLLELFATSNITL